MSDLDDVIDTIIAEAGNKPQGMLAVASAINNRSSKWGMDPGSVVRQKNQFEGYSDPGPGSVRAQKMPQLRQAAMQAWSAIRDGKVPDPIGGATDFRTTGSPSQVKLGAGVNIDGNTFYPTNSGTSLNSTPVPLAPLPVQSYTDTGQAVRGMPASVPSSYASDTSPTTTALAGKLGGYAAKQGWAQPYIDAAIPAAPDTPAAPTLGDRLSEFATAAKAALPAAPTAPTPSQEPMQATLNNSTLGVVDKNKASALYASLLQPGISLNNNPYGSI